MNVGPDVSLLHPRMRAAYDAAARLWRERYPGRAAPRLVDTIRSTATQAAAYRDWLAGRRPNNLPVARPGTSRHEPDAEGYAEAFDVGFEDGRGRSVSDPTLFRDFAALVTEVDPGITWGGIWSGRQNDPVHFQLTRRLRAGLAQVAGAVGGVSAAASLSDTDPTVQRVSRILAYTAAMVLIVYAVSLLND